MFYVWYDEMSSQLKFNVINSKHEKLPFNCNYIFVNSIEEIFNNFLSLNNKSALEKEVFELEIYKEIIKC